jgi:hypothetical protein
MLVDLNPGIGRTRPTPRRILLDPIIRIGALADVNGLQITQCSVFKPVCCAAPQNRFMVGLAASHHDPLWTAKPLRVFCRNHSTAVRLRRSLNQTSTFSFM